LALPLLLGSLFAAALVHFQTPWQELWSEKIRQIWARATWILVKCLLTHNDGCDIAHHHRSGMPTFCDGCRVILELSQRRYPVVKHRMAGHTLAVELVQILFPVFCWFANDSKAHDDYQLVVF
jgi:hypothetical protein